MSLSNLPVTFFARNLARLAIPGPILRARLAPRLARLEEHDLPQIVRRLHYYSRISAPFELDPGADRWRWNAFQQQRNYCFDLLEHLRCFDPSLRLRYRFGDVTAVPEHPTLVKARPIGGENSNSILFKLNKIRHFRVAHDVRRFADKRDQVVWRGKARQVHRRAFLAAHFGDPSCDVGRTDDREEGKEWRKPFLSIEQQLEYKFILSLEGNDVATNLKWIFTSNSACMMSRPRKESWFMEGALIPDHHYILLADDHADMAEKVRFYAARPELAERIVRNAQEHAAQFQDEYRERALCLLVLLKYFVDSGQMGPELLERATHVAAGTQGLVQR